MIQGSGHTKNVSYQTVCVDRDSSFSYLDDTEKLELVEAADTTIDMQVFDIEQRECMGTGSMAYET